MVTRKVFSFPRYKRRGTRVRHGFVDLSMRVLMIGNRSDQTGSETVGGVCEKDTLLSRTAAVQIHRFQFLNQLDSFSAGPRLAVLIDFVNEA
ncbi:MAG: hypothetical protein JO313_05465 [Verrucomicrobia bacterium]|nr:hypothetical protein [Verrucomicrobiota bacterium]